MNYGPRILDLAAVVVLKQLLTMVFALLPRRFVLVEIQQLVGTLFALDFKVIHLKGSKIYVSKYKIAIDTRLLL